MFGFLFSDQEAVGTVFWQTLCKFTCASKCQNGNHQTGMLIIDWLCISSAGKGLTHLCIQVEWDSNRLILTARNVRASEQARPISSGKEKGYGKWTSSANLEEHWVLILWYASMMDWQNGMQSSWCCASVPEGHRQRTLWIKAEKGSNMSGFCFGHVFCVLVSTGTDCTDSLCVFFLVCFICLFDNKNSISQYVNAFFLTKYPARSMKWLRMETI